MGLGGKTMTEAEERMLQWIEKASYEELLYKWRFSPAGDPFFIGKIGDFYQDRMNKLKIETPIEEQVSISKKVGWD